MKTDEPDAMVRAGSELPQVREIQVLGDQESGFLLRCFPNLSVLMADEPLFMYGMNVVTEAFQLGCKPEGEILVQLDFHRMCGTSGTGKSSSAEAAANAMAACTSSAFRLGKSARISSTESPSARLASTVRRVTRVPLKTGSPPQIPLSRTIRSWFMGLASNLVHSYYHLVRCLCRPCGSARPL